MAASSGSRPAVLALCFACCGCLCREATAAGRGPAEVYVVPAVLAAEAELADRAAIEKWAAERGGAVLSSGGVVAFCGPLRLEGGLLHDPHEPTVWRRFVGILEPAEYAALLDGRLLLMDRLSGNAADLLQSALPSWCLPAQLEPFVVGHVHVTDAVHRGATGPNAEAGPELAEALRQSEVEWRRRLAAAPWQAAVGVQPSLTARIEAPDGSPVSTAVDLLACHVRSASVWMPWDACSLVALPEPSHAGAFAARQAVAVVEGPPPVVEIDAAGLYTLAELAAQLNDWRPSTVAPAFASEQLYVSAGRYEAANFRRLMQMASGLLWRRGAGEPPSWCLSEHPPALFTEVADAAALPPFGEWAADRLTDGAPFTAEDVAAAVNEPVVGWSELPAEQRDWLQHHSRRMEIGPAGGWLTTVERVPDELLRDAVVRFKAQTAFCCHYLVPDPDPFAAGRLVTAYRTAWLKAEGMPE